jgi:hypothetical protein
VEGFLETFLGGNLVDAVGSEALLAAVGLPPEVLAAQGVMADGDGKYAIEDLTAALAALPEGPVAALDALKDDEAVTPAVEVNSPILVGNAFHSAKDLLSEALNSVEITFPGTAPSGTQGDAFLVDVEDSVSASTDIAPANIIDSYFGDVNGGRRRETGFSVILVLDASVDAAAAAAAVAKVNAACPSFAISGRACAGVSQSTVPDPTRLRTGVTASQLGIIREDGVTPIDITAVAGRDVLAGATMANFEAADANSDGELSLLELSTLMVISDGSDAKQLAAGTISVVDATGSFSASSTELPGETQIMLDALASMSAELAALRQWKEELELQVPTTEAPPIKAGAQKNDAQTDDAESDDAESSSSSGGSTIVVIGAVLVVLLVIVAAVIYLKINASNNQKSSMQKDSNIAFNNPLYGEDDYMDPDSDNDDSDDGGFGGGSGGASLYMDVDNSPTSPGATAAAGYMDVGAADQYDDDSDDEPGYLDVAPNAGALDEETSGFGDVDDAAYEDEERAEGFDNAADSADEEESGYLQMAPAAFDMYNSVVGSRHEDLDADEFDVDE